MVLSPDGQVQLCACSPWLSGREEWPIRSSREAVVHRHLHILNNALPSRPLAAGQPLRLRTSNRRRRKKEENESRHEKKTKKHTFALAQTSNQSPSLTLSKNPSPLPLPSSSSSSLLSPTSRVHRTEYSPHLPSVATLFPCRNHASPPSAPCGPCSASSGRGTRPHPLGRMWVRKDAGLAKAAGSQHDGGRPLMSLSGPKELVEAAVEEGSLVVAPRRSETSVQEEVWNVPRVGSEVQPWSRLRMWKSMALIRGVSPRKWREFRSSIGAARHKVAALGDAAVARALTSLGVCEEKLREGQYSAWSRICSASSVGRPMVFKMLRASRTEA